MIFFNIYIYANYATFVIFFGLYFNVFTSAHSIVERRKNQYCLNQSNNYPLKSEGICFYRRWFVCMCVCLSVTTITK